MSYMNYFDRIRINTVLPRQILKKHLPISRIQENCHDVKLCRASQYARIHGYEGCVELFQATDEAIATLQRYGLEKHTISRIEVARDRVFNNRLAAERMTKAFQNTHYMRWGKGSFSIGNMRYFGKEEGNYRSIYAVCYTPKKAKLGNPHVMHTEFVLTDWSKIKERLGISSIYDLDSAEIYMDRLYTKYIRYGEVNTKRLEKNFPDISVSNVRELIESIAQIKENLSLRYERRRNMIELCGRRFFREKKIKTIVEYSKKERLWMNQGISYWLK